MLNAFHSHAALLFVDCLISPEGQKMMAEPFGYGTKDYGFKKWHSQRRLWHRQYQDLTDNWQEFLADLTRK